MTVTKQEIREHVWQTLEQHHVGRFPGTRGRIPNFVGAERAADRLCELDVWKRAKVLKCNPDSPLRPVRLRALREGKTVYGRPPITGIGLLYRTATFGAGQACDTGQFYRRCFPAGPAGFAKINEAHRPDH